MQSGDSQAQVNQIRWGNASAYAPPGVVAAMLVWVAGQASGDECDLSDRRHRDVGVRGVFHAEPVVSGASPAAGAWPWAFELREPVRDRQDTQRQSYPRHARCGGAGTA